jgi:quercetin dioxygenase-like cupin family protein
MKTQNGKFQLANEIAWENPDKGIHRQILGYDGQLMVVRVDFEKGAVGNEHVHFHSQASYVVSGKFEVNVDGEKRVLGPGDGFYVAPDLNHGAVCLEAGTLIDTFSPMRLDFVKK